jgi:hypothetical protein
MVTSSGAEFESPLELNLQETCPAGVVAIDEVPVRNPDRLEPNAAWSAETEVKPARRAIPSDHRLRQSKLFLQNILAIAESLVHPGTQPFQITNFFDSTVHRHGHRVGMSIRGDGVTQRDGRFATANKQDVVSTKRRAGNVMFGSERQLRHRAQFLSRYNDRQSRPDMKPINGLSRFGQS